MIPLTAVGQRQAEVVAGVFDRGPDLIVASPFLRARQTAQATIDRFPSVPVEEWAVEEFTYLGGLHGRVTTGAEREPLVRAYWNAADPHHVDDDKSESFADVYNRAQRFLSELARRDPGEVAVFTHGLFMRVVLWLVFTGETSPTTQSMRRFYRFRTAYLIPNCSIVTFSPGREPRVLGATTTHLPRSLRTGGV